MPWTELFSGALGSLLTLAFSSYRESQKAKTKSADELKAVCLLMYFEVNDHLYWLQHLDTVSINMLLSVPDDEWKANSHFLALNLPFEEFSVIVRHYRCIRAVRKVLPLSSGSIPSDILYKYIAAATAAHDKLFILAGLSESALQEYNQLQKQESEA